MRSRRFKLSLCTLGLLAPLLLAGAAPMSGWASSGVTFSGQATVVKGTVAGIPILVADTVPLPSSGRSRDATLLTENVAGVLDAEVLAATAIGQGDTSNA